MRYAINAEVDTSIAVTLNDKHVTDIDVVISAGREPRDNYDDFEITDIWVDCGNGSKPDLEQPSKGSPLWSLLVTQAYRDDAVSDEIVQALSQAQAEDSKRAHKFAAE